MKYISKLILLLLCYFNVNGQVNRFVTYNIEYGIAQNFIYCLNQDNKGNLWIGTGNGLSKFDGYGFINLGLKDSLSGNFISCSHKCNSNLWIGHNNGKISLIEDEKIKSVKFNFSNNSEIEDIEHDYENNIFVASQNGGIFKINKKLESVKLNWNQETPLTCLSFINKNQLIIGTTKGIYIGEITKSNTLNTSSLSEFNNYHIVDIKNHKIDSSIFVLTKQNGLFYIKNIKNHIVVGKVYSSIKDAQSLFIDNENNIWIASFNGGFMLNNKQSSRYIITKQFTEENGLNSNKIKVIYQDQENHIWFGTYGGGLSRLLSDAKELIPLKKEAYGESVYSIFKGEQYNWIGTNKGLAKVNKYTKNIIDFYGVSDNLPADRITAILEYPKGNLWAGTKKTGLYYKGETSDSFTRINIRTGNLENSINKIVAENDNLWFASEKGICCYNIKTKEKKWYNMGKGILPHNSIKDIFLDSKNRLWISCFSKHLLYLKDNKIKKINLNKNNSAINISCITEDSNGSLWIGTKGSGVFCLKGDSIVNFTNMSGVLSNYCYSIGNDTKGRVWVAHKSGISIIYTTNNYIGTIPNIMSTNSNIIFNDNACISSDNSIWFGTEQGLYIYNSDKEKTPVVEPFLKISSVMVNGLEKEDSKKLKLAPGLYKIKFSFKAIKLNDPHRIKYRYKLKGADNTWSAYSSLRNVTYSNLSSGNYSFIVEALNFDGSVIKQKIDFSFKIKMHFWEKLWFQLLLIILIVLSFYVYIFIREQNFKRIQKKLVENLDEKTRELIVKEEVIKERKRNEKELIQAKNKAEESDRLKTAFLLNMSHEIRTPLNSIVGFSRLMQENAIDTASKKRYIEIMNVNTNELLLLVDDIMDISKIESGQIRLKLQDVNVLEIFEILHHTFLNKINIIDNYDINLTYSVPSDNFKVFTDAARLKQILTNLISNAIKFTEKGIVEFGCKLEQERIVFYVKDNGIGISKDKHDIIFLRFRKEDRINSKKLYRGAGLGLTIVKSLVELLKGEVWLESEENEGSIFYFSIPRS
ncbi:two-component regulator propeller domain-containing protein [Marinifilum sp. RC60d5]|uniref:two-component regulator propeller domain-containing protein n=1 Tax=Marinifilum sp. RC60d5 TaxID=3458414 RepID=UPI00403662D9